MVTRTLANISNREDPLETIPNLNDLRCQWMMSTLKIFGKAEDNSYLPAILLTNFAYFELSLVFKTEKIHSEKVIDFLIRDVIE